MTRNIYQSIITTLPLNTRMNSLKRFIIIIKSIHIKRIILIFLNTTLIFLPQRNHTINSFNLSISFIIIITTIF